MQAAFADDLATFVLSGKCMQVLSCRRTHSLNPHPQLEWKISFTGGLL